MEKLQSIYDECKICKNLCIDIICDNCQEIGFWIDPIGTIHGPDVDPSKAYE